MTAHIKLHSFVEFALPCRVLDQLDFNQLLPVGTGISNFLRLDQLGQTGAFLHQLVQD